MPSKMMKESYEDWQQDSFWTRNIIQVKKDQVLLRCVDAFEAHKGIYGTHANGVTP